MARASISSSSMAAKELWEAAAALALTCVAESGPALTAPLTGGVQGPERCPRSFFPWRSSLRPSNIHVSALGPCARLPV